MMIFLAGLQNLGADQLEAARMDGAGPLKRLWHVILPGMRPSLVFVSLTTTILSFRLFVQPYLMTRGGPENRTVSIIQMIYETTFLNRDLGLAGAGTVIFLLSILIPLLIAGMFRRSAI
jgi:ABC-type sugar transport system permease subunit